MIGKTLSHYKVLEKIGQGGMGEVYRAEDTSLKREVAIKVLPEQFTKDPQRLARFEREAQLLASLNHPNIAAIPVEQLCAVGAPKRPSTPFARNLLLRSRPGKGLHIDLGSSRLVGMVRDPATVGRKARSVLPKLGFNKRGWLTSIFQRHKPDISTMAVGQKAPIRRPRRGHVGRVGSRTDGGKLLGSTTSIRRHSV